MQEPWVSHPEVLAKSIEPRAILYGALDEGDYTSLIWLGRDDDVPSAVEKALARWRPVLANRADFLDNPERRWWETHRTRDKDLLLRPKVIALNRTDRGRFAVDEDGSWQPSIKTTLVIPKEDDLSVAYVGGLLNSELLDLWYGIRGKTPRDVWRNYEPKRMKEIPYRHVDLSIKVPGERLQKLDAALKAHDALEAGALADAIGSDLRARGADGLGADAPEALEAARALEAFVRAIADNRRALLPFRDRFPELARVVKDPWSTKVVDPVVAPFVGALPKKNRASVRVDPELKSSFETDATLGKGTLRDGKLVFAYRKKEVARIDGPPDKLLLLSELLAEQTRLMPADVLGAELPRDVDAFRDEVEETKSRVSELLAQGRDFVEAAERLVCALYGVSPELEEDVVAHAMARANSVS
jgi:hypothetical protein